MSQFDLSMKSSLITLVLPSLGAVLCIFVFKKRFSSLCKFVITYLVHRVSKKLHGKWTNKKRKLFASMESIHLEEGDSILLEIGIGGGNNFQYYPRGTTVVCVDPNPYFERYLKESLEESKHIHFKEFILGFAEDMRSDIDSCSCDVVVCTLVLCSVQNTSAVLKEILRVLKPGGKYYFIEHIGPVRKTWTYRVAAVLNPVYRIFADGCELTRDTKCLIDQAGFSEIDYDFKGGRIFGGLNTVFFGVATK